MLALESLLQPFGFDVSVPTKLVRHQDSRFDVPELYATGRFELYQAMQSAPVFRGARQLISFLGRPGTHAAFVGVYRVDGVEGPADFDVPPEFPPPTEWTQHYRYALTLDSRFEEMRGRLVIDWGRSTRAWCQNFRPQEKAVIEVLPTGYVRDFPGFLDVVLTHAELVDIIDHPVAHRDWHRMLASVAGVYLILDTRNGAQYVGAAYGVGGILGRWRAYAERGHGGNVRLRALVAADAQAARHFRFSILQTLPIHLTPAEVIRYEVLHKHKLGSRAHGLNEN